MTTKAKKPQRKPQRKVKKVYNLAPRPHDWATPKLQRLVENAAVIGWQTEMTATEIVFVRGSNKWRFLAQSKCFIATHSNEIIRSIKSFEAVISG